MATTFTNTATLSYNGVSVRSNVAVGTIEGVLSVSKNTAAQDYHIGDTLTYVVSIVNNSDAAVTGVTVTDDLGAYAFGTEILQPLDYVAGSVQYYSDGVLQPAPAVSTTSGLAFSNITIPANGSVILIYEATVNEFASPEAGSVIDNTVTVTAAGINDVTATESIPATSDAILSVLKSVTPVPVAENGTLTYTFELQNVGNTAVETTDTAVVSDTFDPVLTDISVTLDGATLTQGTDYTYDETTGVFNTVQGVLSIPAATFTQDAVTGAWSTVPGTATLTVTGTVSAV